MPIREVNFAGRTWAASSWRNCSRAARSSAMALSVRCFLGPGTICAKHIIGSVPVCSPSYGTKGRGRPGQLEAVYRSDRSATEPQPKSKPKTFETRRNRGSRGQKEETRNRHLKNKTKSKPEERLGGSKRKHLTMKVTNEKKKKTSQWEKK